MSEKTYGSPRIFQEWKGSISVSENTVAKYMREMGLDARLKKRFRVQTTDSNHDHPIAPRLFKVEDDNPLPKGPFELLAGDITYLKYGNKFVYLAKNLDLFNREVVGWSMGDDLRTGSFLSLRKKDSSNEESWLNAEVIFHSDRGSQYASEA